uniref:Hydroxylysine kinase n=1 Tax=Phallusia mammillata TaxID=59560 RepID=A0A6F9DFN0_9ASCI|nr:hydroxylysine kinase [Phallusia mammillata]
MYQMQLPVCEEEDAIKLTEALYGFADVKATKLYGWDDKNFLIRTPDHHKYVLKVVNTFEAKIPERYTEMCDMLQALYQRGFTVPCPIKNRWNSWILLKCMGNTVDPNLIFMLSFLPGKTMDAVHFSEKNFHELTTDLAEFVAKIHIESMAHNYKGWDVSKNLWRMESITTRNTAPILCLVKDLNLRRICSRVVEKFESTVLTKLEQLRSGVIHGDLNPANALVEKVETINGADFYKLSGLIDFIEMKQSKLVFEVATLIAFWMGLAQKRKFDKKLVIKQVLEGYERHLCLSDTEKQCLNLTVMARLVSYICSAMSNLNDRDYDTQDSNYVLRMFDSTCCILRSLWADED